MTNLTRLFSDIIKHNVFLLAIFFCISKSYTQNENPISPPLFSHEGGFYTEEFYLSLETPYNGIYSYSVAKPGYQTAYGTVQAIPDTVFVQVILYSDKKKKGNSIKEKPDSNQKNTFHVQFFVDMTDSPYQTGDQVYISGTMVDPHWPEPGSNPDMQMQPVDEDPLTYTISFDLVPGEYAYKYFLNSGWGGGEWSGQPNREVSVFSNVAFHDIWGVIDPDEPDDPEDPEGFATIVFIVEKKKNFFFLIRGFMFLKM